MLAPLLALAVSFVPAPGDDPPAKPQSPPKAAAPKDKDKAEAEDSGVLVEPGRDEGPDPRDFEYSPAEAIALFQARAKANPEDFVSRAQLGELYERQARDTDDLAGYARAEESFRQALALLPKYPRARVGLAAVLCDRHKFAEGLALAQSILKDQPDSLPALATLGDAQLELGRYAEADASFHALDKKLPDAAPVLARLARLAELKGRTDEALSILRRAVDAFTKKGATPGDLAWYRVRIADILMNAGRVDEAEAIYRDVLKAVPKQHDATAGLGRVLVARGRTAEAIAQYEQAVAIGPDAHMVTALADLYTLAGDPAKARATEDGLEKRLQGQPEHSRSLTYFYLDHDRELPKALEMARAELTARQDVYGHDALAWALFKNGHAEEAAAESAEALKLGTRDARLLYHAGMIHHHLGHADQARDYLRKALDLDPHFSIPQAEEARKTLGKG